MSIQQVAEALWYTPAYVVQLIPPPSWDLVAWMAMGGIGMAALGLIFELTKNAQAD